MKELIKWIYLWISDIFFHAKPKLKPGDEYYGQE